MTPVQVDPAQWATLTGALETLTQQHFEAAVCQVSWQVAQCALMLLLLSGVGCLILLRGGLRHA